MRSPYVEGAAATLGGGLGVALMGAAAAADTGWSLLLSAGVCALAWPAFARARPTATRR